MSEIPYHKLRSLPVRTLIRALERDGFVLDHQRGSHRVYYHSDGRRVVLPIHSSGQTFPLKTLKGIVQDAGWAYGDLIRLKIVSE